MFCILFLFSLHFIKLFIFLYFYTIHIFILNHYVANSIFLLKGYLPVNVDKLVSVESSRY
ncbi:hypothetical protein O3M35_005338 [Rhynocoris fuscipes]|uniref:Uncharacterized protein n=1 Tax=Rhynocoris fuscipes TaxID=488301 RepID=A0AAW1DHU1_9HEMI